MANNNSSFTSNNFNTKEYHSKSVLNRHEFEFYDEDKDVVERVCRVVRTNSRSKGENWKLFCNDKLIFVINGAKISKVEKEFLRTIDGFNFLIGQAKGEIKSLNKLRLNIKESLKNK